MADNHTMEKIRDLKSLEAAIQGCNPTQLDGINPLRTIIENTLLIGEFKKPVPIAQANQAGSKLRLDDVEWYGSGLKLTQHGIIITAYHVIEKIEAKQQANERSESPEGMSRYFIMDSTGRMYSIDSAYSKIISSETTDFAIIKMEMGISADPVPFLVAKEDLPLGAIATAYGYFNNNGTFLVSGRYGTVVNVSAKFKHITTRRCLFDPFAVQANTPRGYSGGPIVSAKGELSGIMSSSLALEPSYTLGVKITHIKDGIQTMIGHAIGNR